MALEITRTDEAELTTLLLEGTLDTTTADQMRPIIEAIIAEHRIALKLDMHGVELIDSVGVAEIIRLYKHAQHNGGHCDVVGVRDQPLAIFKLLRYDKLFKL